MIILTEEEAGELAKAYRDELLYGNGLIKVAIPEDGIGPRITHIPLEVVCNREQVVC